MKSNSTSTFSTDPIREDPLFNIPRECSFIKNRFAATHKRHPPNKPPKVCERLSSGIHGEVFPAKKETRRTRGASRTGQARHLAAKKESPPPRDLLTRKVAILPQASRGGEVSGLAVLSLLRFQFITSRQIITDKSGDGFSPLLAISLPLFHHHLSLFLTLFVSLPPPFE